ncbi:hypothetical protein PoB_005819000 [Plakobranchus ocellatus]|uniref:Uncharacterized protein n=1 Tax=Plakobranchus ocellatus TaxID=259542 RepID=A0AAV4CIP7_9GAST|nr:hypothetical protein PoB_005819000 [Plakobranchus ocellatus]
MTPSNDRNNFVGVLADEMNSPQQGDLRPWDPPPGQVAYDEARNRDRRVPADLRADSPATLPPTPHRAKADTPGSEWISPNKKIH